MDDYRKRMNTPAGIAFCASLIVGFFTHLFALVNILHNHDDIVVQPWEYGTGLTSGRWLLTILGDWVKQYVGNYDMSWVKGGLFLFFLAVSAALIVSVLRLQNKKSAVLIGAVFVVFPTVVSTMFYRYTSTYYGLAVMFSVLAVWVLERYSFGLPLCVICIACSLGIYQAYVPITIGLCVLLLIRDALCDTGDFWRIVRRGLLFCTALALGVLLYWGLLQYFLNIYGTALSNYQGVSSMGRLSLTEIPGLVMTAFFSFCKLPVSDYCGIAQTVWLRYSYGLLGLLSIGLMMYILWAKRKSGILIGLTGLLCLLFPVAVNFIVVMCPAADIETLMVYAFVLIFCVPFVVLEELPAAEVPGGKQLRRFVSRGISLILIVVILNYGYLANVNYSVLYYANRQAENYLNSIVIQARMQEGFMPSLKWVFLGKIEDPMFSSPWQWIETYGGSSTTEELINAYSRNSWIRHYFGYHLPMADADVKESLIRNQEVKDMPCWPSEGSIQIIGDTVVIKFQDLASD